MFKDPQRPSYPTQKNAAMLERIIRTSSEPGDTVLDCYAGSGSTLLEAARLGRRFIGMDDSRWQRGRWPRGGLALRESGGRRLGNRLSPASGNRFYYF